MTRGEKIGLALLCAAIPGLGWVAGAVWLVRRARARNYVTVVRPSIEVIDLTAVRERLARGEDDWP